MLILNERHKSLICLSMRNQKCAEVEKFRTMLDYQFELGYDLALAKEINASTNAGYDVVLGVVTSIEQSPRQMLPSIFQPLIFLFFQIHK